MKPRVVGTIIVIVLVAAAGAAARSAFLGSTPNGDRPVVYAVKADHETSVPQSASTPQEIADAILQRYGGQQVISITVADPPNGEAGLWLNFTAHVPNAYDVERAGWESDILQGAVADALHERGFGQIIGSTIAGHLPDGTILPDIGGGMGSVAVGQTFSNESDATIVSTLTRILANAGLTAVSIDVLHADQPAPAIVAETNDPAGAAAEAAATSHALFGGAHPPRFEGFYFEVRDLSSKPLFVLSYAYRSASGRQWVTPTLRDLISLDTL